LPPFPVNGAVSESLKSSEKSRVAWEVRAAGDIDDLGMATKNRREEENRRSACHWLRVFATIDSAVDESRRAPRADNDELPAA
jgi:hypothetical protein